MQTSVQLADRAEVVRAASLLPETRVASPDPRPKGGLPLERGQGHPIQRSPRMEGIQFSMPCFRWRKKR